MRPSGRRVGRLCCWSSSSDRAQYSANSGFTVPAGAVPSASVPAGSVAAGSVAAGSVAAGCVVATAASSPGSHRRHRPHRTPRAPGSSRPAVIGIRRLIMSPSFEVVVVRHGTGQRPHEVGRELDAVDLAAVAPSGVHGFGLRGLDHEPALALDALHRHPPCRVGHRPGVVQDGCKYDVSGSAAVGRAGRLSPCGCGRSWRDRCVSSSDTRSSTGAPSAGRWPQRVLAALAIAAGPVSRDQLGDAVWGDTLPRTWEAALRGAVHKLRRAASGCGAGEIVRTAFGAYQLDTAVAVDVTGRGRLGRGRRAGAGHRRSGGGPGGGRRRRRRARSAVHGRARRGVDRRRAGSAGPGAHPCPPGDERRGDGARRPRGRGRCGSPRRRRRPVRRGGPPSADDRARRRR